MKLPTYIRHENIPQFFHSKPTKDKTILKSNIRKIIKPILMIFFQYTCSTPVTVPYCLQQVKF